MTTEPPKCSLGLKQLGSCPYGPLLSLSWHTSDHRNLPFHGEEQRLFHLLGPDAISHTIPTGKLKYGAYCASVVSPTLLLWNHSKVPARCYLFYNAPVLPELLQSTALATLSAVLHPVWNFFHPHKGLLAWSKSVLFTNNVLLGLASWRARKVKRQPTCDGVKSEFSTMTWEALGRKGKNKNTSDWCCSCLWESNQDTATRNPCTAIMSPPTLDIYTISWC